MADPHHHHTATENGGDSGDQSPARREWERVPSDPDLHDDLEYELLDLETYETDENRIIILPKDEDMIRKEAFIVTGEDALHSLE